MTLFILNTYIGPYIGLGGPVLEVNICLNGILQKQQKIHSVHGRTGYRLFMLADLFSDYNVSIELHNSFSWRR